MPLELEQMVDLLGAMEGRLGASLRISEGALRTEIRDIEGKAHNRELAQERRNSEFASQAALDKLEDTVQQLTQRSLERTLLILTSVATVVIAVSLTIILSHGIH